MKPLWSELDQLRLWKNGRTRRTCMSMMTRAEVLRSIDPENGSISRYILALLLVRDVGQEDGKNLVFSLIVYTAFTARAV